MEEGACSARSRRGHVDFARAYPVDLLTFSDKQEDVRIYPPRRFSRFDRKPAEPESRINDMIRGIAEVRLIDAEGKQVGIVPLQQGPELGCREALVLVESSATATPTVCKIMDYGKYIFQQKKKQA